MDSVNIFMAVIAVVMTIAVLGVFGAILYYSIKKIVKRKSGEDTDDDNTLAGPIYGAWQGHTFGTTSYEPGELTKIERELGTEPKHSEE
jgi:hypothetical protein